MRFRFGFQKNYTKSRFYTKFTYTKSSVDCTNRKLPDVVDETFEQLVYDRQVLNRGRDG